MDFLYIFNFSEDNIDNAIKRFKCSLESIRDQDVNICISNNSSRDIENDIKEVIEDFSYIHKQYDGPFSRSHAINFGVKQLVKSKYFILSDIDLVYQENHINIIKNKLKESDSDKPIRIINYNYNINTECYSSNYNSLVALPKANIGYAHGNGLIHLDSFYKIHGYNESLIGYGPEDALFNERLKRINNVIYCTDKEITTAHIFHPRLQMIQFEKNHQIYDIQMASLGFGHDDYVIANKDKEDWGVI